MLGVRPSPSGSGEREGEGRRGQARLKRRTASQRPRTANEADERASQRWGRTGLQAVAQDRRTRDRLRPEDERARRGSETDRAARSRTSQSGRQGSPAAMPPGQRANSPSQRRPPRRALHLAMPATLAATVRPRRAISRRRSTRRSVRTLRPGDDRRVCVRAAMGCADPHYRPLCATESSRRRRSAGRRRVFPVFSGSPHTLVLGPRWLAGQGQGMARAWPAGIGSAGCTWTAFGSGRTAIDQKKKKKKKKRKRAARSPRGTGSLGGVGMGPGLLWIYIPRPSTTRDHRLHAP
ncbi:hypothetical protein VTN02DRAFT_2480 [Thermoascus thermophilus]